MAAIATIKQGYQRYAIGGMGSSAEPTAVVPIGTYGTGFAVMKRNNTALDVTMFNPGDVGFELALDAKETLGEDWETKVNEGVNTCT